MLQGCDHFGRHGLVGDGIELSVATAKHRLAVVLLHMGEHGVEFCLVAFGQKIGPVQLAPEAVAASPRQAVQTATVPSPPKRLKIVPGSAAVTFGCSSGVVSQMEKIVRRSLSLLCWMPQ